MLQLNATIFVMKFVPVLLLKWYEKFNRESLT